MIRFSNQNNSHFVCLKDASGRKILLADAQGSIEYYNEKLIFKEPATAKFSDDENAHWRHYADIKPYHLALSTEQLLAEDLHRALQLGQLDLAAQAIFDFDSRQISAVEMLLRWDHPQLGAISPLKIIEMAVDNQFLYEVASFVTQRTIEFMLLNQPQCAALKFAINLNLPQITDSHLISHLLDLIDDSGLDRSMFIFESTETHSLPIPTIEAAEHFNQIRSHGIIIAMDDFGAGYSTLDYLNNFDVDLIKLDRSLVSGIESNPRKLDTLLTLVRLCKRLGVTPVIEGIENQHQHQLIGNSGIDGILVQGYWYAHPLPLCSFCLHNLKMSDVA